MVAAFPHPPGSRESSNSGFWRRPWSADGNPARLLAVAVPMTADMGRTGRSRRNRAIVAQPSLHCNINARDAFPGVLAARARIFCVGFKDYRVRRLLADLRPQGA